MKAKIKALDFFLPLNVEVLEDLKRENPGWDISKVYDKTGINARYIADSEQTASDLAFNAAKKLLDNHKDFADKIDSLIFVSQSPDYFLPSTACILQERLSLSQRSLAFDINQGCSGFVIALGVGGSLIDAGQCENVLILCADTYTKYINRDDRTCRPIFSDGAAAILLQKAKTDDISKLEFGTDGSGYDKLIVRQGGARHQSSNPGQQKASLEMLGSDVFLFTMNVVPRCIENLLRSQKLQIEDIDLFVFHQASKLVIENLIRSLGLSEQKVFNGLSETGNTVSASIPIALKLAENKGRLREDDLVLVAGFGVGLSWGATLLRWSKS